MRVYVELFVSATCGTGPRGQGQKLLGSVQTRTNSGGRASFTVHVASLSPGQIVTATATNTTRDPSVHDGSAKVLDTSEFSRCFKVRPRPTRTAVVCQPTTVPVGSVTRCTATVADAAPGPGATPRGSVHFSTSSSGSFSQGGKCTLKGGRCQITYTPKEVGTGTVRITARFGGSRSHTASAGHAKLAVQRAQ
jgi:hypothetical protein